MPNNQESVPETKLLNSIIDEELKEEEDNELKEVIKMGAMNLYPFLSFLTEKSLNDEDIKKKIKLLIEGE